MVKTAVILAAGRGSKIWPYGDTWPKAALPIANWPLIQWQIEAMQSCGVENFIVVVDHLAGQIRSAVTEYEAVECIEQPRASGTAEALLHALDYVEDEKFLVVNGDTLFTEEDMGALLELARNNPEPCALVQALGTLPPNEWLCANLEEDSIKEIWGHPRESTHRLCGIYVLNRDMVPYLENHPGFMISVEVGAMPPQEFELAESLSQFIKAGGAVAAIETQELFVDIDKPWHLLDANSAFLNYLGAKLSGNELAAGAVIEEGAEIEGFVVMGENAFIGHDVKIKGNLWIGANSKVIDGAIIGSNSCIGEKTIIREYCRVEENTSIGSNCIVGHGAEVGGILMDGAYSFHYGEYWGIIGRSADLGAATVCGNLRFDDQKTVHRTKGRKETPTTNSVNAAYMGDYTRTGVNTILMPGVRIGAYSVVGAGVILNEDLPNNSLIYVKQDQVRTTWGPDKYGW